MLYYLLKKFFLDEKPIIIQFSKNNNLSFNNDDSNYNKEVSIYLNNINLIFLINSKLFLGQQSTPNLIFL